LTIRKHPRAKILDAPTSSGKRYPSGAGRESPKLRRRACLVSRSCNTGLTKALKGGLLDRKSLRPYVPLRFSTLRDGLLSPLKSNSASGAQRHQPAYQRISEDPMAKTKFRPLHDRVVVKRIDAEEKTAGGIIIPDTAKEKPSQGQVIAVGPGGRDET